MADDEQLSETLLDLFVYAPIGLALDAKQLIPQLAERGRGQVALARLAGAVANRQGATDPGVVIDTVTGVVQSLVSDLLGTDDAAASPTADATDGATLDPPTNAEPIPGYDTMTAAEIVPLLAETSPDEQIAIARYEEAHRARKTVLRRLEQLQG